MDSWRRLHEHEAHCASVVRTMAEGVVLHDAAATIVGCNEAAERLLGLTADEMMGRTARDPRWRAIREDGTPFPGDEHPASVTLRTGTPLRAVVMGVYRPDDAIAWISINSEPLFRSGEASPYAAVCTFSDITAYKRTEDELRRSEEQYRQIVETTLEGVWIIDLEGTTVFANARMADMLGCTPDELAASRVWDFMAPEDRASVTARLAARARGVAEVHDFTLVRRDGGVVQTSMATSTLTLPGGGRGALAMVRDVTHERRIETQLRESHERLELALEVGQLGTWEWVLGSDRVLASPQLRELVGVGPDEPLDSPAALYAMVHADDLGELDAQMRAVLARAAGERFVHAFRVVRRDGSVRWVRSAGRILGERVLGTIVDITETRALEEQLRQAQQLESIGRLAGGVAHDFNNLLTAILASVTIAESLEVPAVAEELRTIREAAERGAAVTRQLLAFARKQVIQLAALDLNAILRNLAGVLQRLVGEDIAIVYELAKDLGTVRGDATQLEQVIINLVVNAREAMPRGGSVRIATRNVGQRVVLSVIDTGTGIAPSVLPHIFEPFYSTKQRGTGMGLASAYGIVQQLGGQLRVHSEPGDGATFTVSLPRDANAPPLERAHHPEARAHKAGTLLLVEDDELLRGIIARSLDDVGYRVLTARDGEDALAVAAAHAGAIDLLITDVVMPKLSGRDLAEQLTRVRPATRTLFVSGYNEQIVARHGVLDAGDHFLAKPYTIDVLERRIDELLR